MLYIATTDAGGVAVLEAPPLESAARDQGGTMTGTMHRVPDATAGGPVRLTVPR